MNSSGFLSSGAPTASVPRYPDDPEGALTGLVRSAAPSPMPSHIISSMDELRVLSAVCPFVVVLCEETCNYAADDVCA